MSMKKNIYILLILTTIVFTACNDDDVNVFDKTADERVSEAIGNLKQELIAPPNGWKVKYRPVTESGAYYVLMKFGEDNKVSITSDLSAEDGKYTTQTISYRIDSSLGLELVLENYNFFSFLFEQNMASFGAEFEFIYTSKTPDNALVFRSKTDLTNPVTILTFEEATATDASLVSPVVSGNLSTIINNIDKYSSSLKLTYDSKDLIFYLSLTELTRTVTVRSVSKKTNTAEFSGISFTSPYVLKNDSIVFDTPLKGSFLGNSISLRGIKLNTFSTTQVTPCLNPIDVNAYSGVTSQGDNVVLEPTFFNHDEATFATDGEIYFGELYYILDENGNDVTAQIKADLIGAEGIVIYNENSGNDPLKAIGFLIVNADGSVTIPVRKYTPTFVGNQINFAFDPDITVLRNTTTNANVNNIDIYLDKMAEGGKTHLFKINDFAYEIYNTCNGWRFIFQVVN